MDEGHVDLSTFCQECRKLSSMGGHEGASQALSGNDAEHHMIPPMLNASFPSLHLKVSACE